MHPADSLMWFMVAAFATNILTLIMILGLPAAYPRSMPPTPKPSSGSLSLDSSERANTDIQDSPPSTQAENKPTEDDLAASSSGHGMNPEELALSPGGKFGLATIVLAGIVLSLVVQFTCLQKWKECYPVPVAWWDIFETVLSIIFVFELGIASLALGRWLMLLCDLWGEAGRKLWLIREYFLFMWIAIAIAVPLVLLSEGLQVLYRWYRSRPRVRKE